MLEEFKLDLMKKFKELNVAEYTTKYGDYYGLMFAGAEIATKELEAQIEKMKCCETCRYYDYHEIGTGNKDCILWYRDKVFCEHKNMWELGR